MRLSVIVQPGEDGFCSAEGPALPDCMSQGHSEREILRNIKEAIALWLEVEAEKRAGELPRNAVVRTMAV